MLSTHLPRSVRFANFELNTQAGELRTDNRKVHLQEQPLQILMMLIERTGDVVTRQELHKALWPGSTFGDLEDSLNHAVRRLREALGDTAEHPRLIETVPRRGYRFIASVEALAPVVSPLGRESPAGLGEGSVAPVGSPVSRPVGADRVPAQGHPQGAPLRGWAAMALAGVALIAVIGGAAWFHFFPPARKAAGPPTRIVALTSFPGQQGRARFSPDGNQIAFVWNGEKEDNWDIYVKMIGTEKPLRLTTDPGVDMAPAWSPDGRSIAFCRRNQREDAIYVVPALGGPERKLYSTSADAMAQYMSSDWSPDGKYLAYVDRRPGPQTLNIFLLALDNTQDKRPLTTSPHVETDFNPRFSPDGQTVAFVRASGEGGAAHDIFLVRTAGGEPKRLTFDSVLIYGLDWTPDGAYIVFSSDRLGGARLWKARASGGEPEPLPVGQEGANAPALSRTGRRLAYTQVDIIANIWRYEVSTGRNAPPTKLIASTGVNESPQFSPDGKRIAFASNRSGSWEIWVCDSDGSNARQLTFFEGPFANWPRWSPDGRQIAFSGTAEGHYVIYVVGVEGGRPRHLMTGASSDYLPSWSRDGKWIYFVSERTGPIQVWKMPAEGGRAVQVTKQGGHMALESPDGKTLYYAKRCDAPGLWKVPVEGGEETLVLDQLAEEQCVRWGVTAEGIYFYNVATKAIEFFSFARHRITQIAKPERPGREGLAVSPDGRWILYSQVDQHTSRIMLAENFRW